MTKQYNIYFHVSPESSITKFKGRFSKKFNTKGVFVCPIFRNLCLDWAPYVAYKKHPKNTNNRYKEYYRNLTVYRIQIPKNVIFECQKLYNKCYDLALEKVGKNNENQLLGAWGWGPELFIPEDFLQELVISNKKTYNYHDLLKQGLPFFHQRHLREQDKTILAYAKKNGNFVSKFYTKTFNASINLSLKNSNIINDKNGISLLKKKYILSDFNSELAKLQKFIVESDLYGFEYKLKNINKSEEKEAKNIIYNIENKFLELSKNLLNLKKEMAPHQCMI